MRKSLVAFHEYGIAPVTPSPGRDTPSCCIRATHVLPKCHNPVGVAFVSHTEVSGYPMLHYNIAGQIPIRHIHNPACI